LCVCVCVFLCVCVYFCVCIFVWVFMCVYVMEDSMLHRKVGAELMFALPWECSCRTTLWGFILHFGATHPCHSFSICVFRVARDVLIDFCFCSHRCAVFCHGRLHTHTHTHTHT
jgi:hypothetical protein